MNRPKTKTKPKQTEPAPDLPDDVKYITIKVPYYTGDLDVNARDVSIQALLTDAGQKENWMRFNHAMQLLHDQMFGSHMLEHMAHNRARSVRWLLGQLKG